ncbi:MAG TPA: GntR family transcriptional regulator [Acidimicrobiales bacterium]|jgi:DNA-binding GntR family transcriptional regulator
MTPLSTSPILTRTKLEPNSSIPIREQAVAALREAINDFRLRPGERLIEREFIEYLGISRTTFREAIRELAAEGLVTVVAQKGARVSAPSLAEALDLYDIRASLESLLVSRFVERATSVEMDALVDSVEAFRLVVEETTDTVALLNSKERFYQVLIAGARSPVLEQQLVSIKARSRVLRATSLSKPGRATATLNELAELARAIVARDEKRAMALCAQHVRNAGEIALAGLRAGEGGGTDPSEWLG